MDIDPGDAIEIAKVLSEKLHLSDRLRERVSWRLDKNRTAVPDVRQFRVADARATLHDAGLRVAPAADPVSDTAIVADQDPVPGTVIRRGKAVKLRVWTDPIPPR